jgi:hypothetical protein
MSEDSGRARDSAGGVPVRTMEALVALVFFALGALVVYDSHRLGSSWGSDGPEAGYFPFYIGALMCLSSVVVFAQALWGRAARTEGVFVEWPALKHVAAVLVPAAFYVLGIQLVGLYIASALYIAGFMRWLGNYSWVKSVLLSVAVAALSFVTFEIWFQVPLFKGAFDPLAFLGY